MSKSVDNLILDLLEWIGQGERPYRETMEGGERRARACRSGRTRPISAFIERRHQPGGPALVSVSAAGAEHLKSRRKASPV